MVSLNLKIVKDMVLDKTTILTDEQVEYVVENALNLFGSDMGGMIKQASMKFENIIRLSSLGAKCKQVREGLELSIKDVSGKLKVPQYRLKAIDAHHRSEILPEVLEKYIEFLELESWFEEWKDANPDLAKTLTAQ